ncbi:hypothetical protein BDN70DRAFT_820018, partial [Pholiota conissans]
NSCAMVNPGAFLGSRKEFLAAQQELYATSITENHVADTVADIQRRYFKRYPLSLPHNEEPSSEWLANVNDDAPDEDLLLPDQSALDEQAFKAAMSTYNEQVKLLKFRKDQISRRLQYQYNKGKAPAKRIEVGSNDPIAIMQAKLTGVPMKKPRLRQAYNIWERVKTGNVSQHLRAAIRSQVYRDCFNELDEDEKKEYEKEAVEEHKATLAKIEEGLNGPASQDPEDRQRVLAALPNFVQPILDLITQHSGWKATLIVGGPEPADHGRLNIMSFHSGETSGSVKMNFGRAERRAYKDYVTPIFGSFLKKCYTVEECRAAALTNSDAISLMEALCTDGGDSYCVDSAEDAVNNSRIARTPGTRTASGSSQGNDTPSTPISRPTYKVPARIGPPIHLKKPVQDLHATPSPTTAAPEKRRRNKSVTEEGTTSVGPNDGPRKRLRSSKPAATHATHSAEVSTPPGGMRTRARAVAEESAAPLTPAQLSAAPDWFLPIYQMLLSGDLGPAWTKLVREWAHFESAEKFEEKGKLGSAGRPACISLWIKYARSASFRPDLGPLPRFEEAFNRSNSILRRDTSGDLTNLRRPGKNGLLSVVAALFFWGVSSKEVPHNQCWMVAVDDVYWVIHYLGLNK